MFESASTDPLVTFTEKDSQLTIQWHVPSNAVPATGTDGHLHIVSPDKTEILETWQAVKNDETHYTASRWERGSLLGDGLGPDNGTRAYGGSAIGGLIRKWGNRPKSSTIYRPY